jgi:hypothetical protein
VDGGDVTFEGRGDLRGDARRLLVGKPILRQAALQPERQAVDDDDLELTQRPRCGLASTH